MGEKVIQLSDYPLVYHEVVKDPSKSRMVRVKRVTQNDYVVLDPITGDKENLSEKKLRERFVCDERNKKLRTENFRKNKTLFDFQ